jgi:hypothetical protein
MKTYYQHNAKGQWARYYYDPSIRLWTVYQVTAPNNEADQIGDAGYCIKANLKGCIESVLRHR